MQAKNTPVSEREQFAMSNTFSFDLVSPERLLVSREVGMLTIPGEEGEFGVLPGHAPLVSSLRTGIISVHDNGQLSDRIFVAGGFAEVSPERCTVLAEEAVPLSELDRATLEADIKKLNEELLVAEGEARTVIEARIARTGAKLAVLAGH
jgi:F-type H+-transporting ATPase subunit epsilon